MSAVDRPIWLVVAAMAVFDLVTAFFFLCKSVYKFMFIIRFQFRFCVRVFMYSKIHKQANKNGGNLYFAFYICIFLNSVIISDR